MARQAEIVSIKDGEESILAKGAISCKAKFLMINAQKVFIVGLVEAPCLRDETVIELQQAKEGTVEVRFAHAGLVVEEIFKCCMDHWADTLKKQQKVLEKALLAKQNETKVDVSSQGQPAKKATKAIFDDYAVWHTDRLAGSSTSNPTSGPSDGDGPEAKRQRIDSKVGTHGARPLKEWSNPTSGPSKPKVVQRSGIIQATRTETPQMSSSYQGYRTNFPFAYGLQNLGNTCYLNAVMQAFGSLREFVADLRATPKVIPVAQQGKLFQCTVETLQQMSAASAATGSVNPSKLREQIALAAPMFAGSRQQDAHEFLLEYLNQLHDELLLAAMQSPENEKDPALATQQHFDSEVQKTLVCIQCQESREVRERFRDFSIDLGPADSQTCKLRTMMTSYFDRELLEVNCEHCNAAAAHMVKRLASHPRVLVLHLKRFVPNFECKRYDKRHQSVDVPMRFDLQSWLGSEESSSSLSPSPSRLPARPLAAAAAASQNGVIDVEPSPPESTAKSSGVGYALRSVVAHEGNSPQSGHYVCYAKGESGNWRLYDDSVVTDMAATEDFRALLGRKGYILFYVREDQPAIVAQA